MDDLQLEVFGKLLTICQTLLKINHQLHSFIEFIVKEFQYFIDVLANRHFLFLILEDWRDGMANFFFIFNIQFHFQGNNRKADGDDIFNLHEPLFGCHIKPSLLLNGIIDVILLQVLINFSLSLIVDPGVGKHLTIFLEYLLIIETVIYHIEHPISKIGKTADYDQLQGMLADLMIQDFLLIGPVEYQGSSILEMQFLVIDAVELEEQVYQMAGVQELLIPMKVRIGSDDPQVVIYELRFVMEFDLQLLRLGEVLDLVLLIQFEYLFSDISDVFVPIEDEQLMREEVN